MATKKASAKVNVRPLGDRILVKRIEEEEVLKGGIIIPDTAGRGYCHGSGTPEREG